MPTPNTQFTSGAIYTAQQANNFPRGVMATTPRITSANFTAEGVDIVSTFFTADSTRLYRITYYSPQSSVNVANGFTVFRIRKGATTGGPAITQGINSNASAGLPSGKTTIGVTTLTAGSQQVCGTIASSSTTSTVYSATGPGFILVEDIGPS